MAHFFNHSFSRRKLLFFFGLIFLLQGPSFSLVVAQEVPKSLIDSLKNRLNSELKDSTYIRELTQISEAYLSVQLDSAERYAQEAFALAGEIQYILGLGFSRRIRGLLYIKQGKMLEAVEELEAAIQIFKEEQDSYYWVLSLKNLGNVYLVKGVLQEALDIYLEALREAEKKSFHIIGMGLMNNIGIIYWYQEKYEQGIAILKKSIDLSKAMGQEREMNKALNNLASIYEQMGKYKPALILHKKALAIQLKLEDKMGESISLSNIGEVHRKLANYEKAEEYMQAGLKAKKSLADEVGITRSYVMLTKLFYDQKKYTEALSQAQIAKKYGLSKGLYREMKDLYQTLHQINFELNQPDSAYVYALLEEQYSDSLLNYEKMKEIEKLEAEFRFSKQKEKHKTEKAQQALIHQQEMRLMQFWLILFGGALLSLSLLVLSYLWAYKKIRLREKELKESQKKLKDRNQKIEFQHQVLKQNKLEIEALNQALHQKLEKNIKENESKSSKISQFTYFNSHQLRLYIANLMGLQSLIQDENDLESAKNYIHLMGECTQKLDELIHEIQRIMDED